MPHKNRSYLKGTFLIDLQTFQTQIRFSTMEKYLDDIQKSAMA